MAVTFIGNSVIIGAKTIRAGVPLSIRQIGAPIIVGPQSIPLALVPQWHAYFLQQAPSTRQLEQDGAVLIAAGFPFLLLDKFIRDVCTWGKYPGIAGRVLKRNTQQNIIYRFKRAAAALGGPLPAQTALLELNQLSNLGTPSFASKHLRFMCPSLCPVLDSYLERDLGYAFNPTGYQLFSTDCCTIAKKLDAANIALPGGALWRAADVEMSIFVCLYG